MGRSPFEDLRAQTMELQMPQVMKHQVVEDGMLRCILLVFILTQLSQYLLASEFRELYFSSVYKNEYCICYDWSFLFRH